MGRVGEAIQGEATSDRHGLMQEEGADVDAGGTRVTGLRCVCVYIRRDNKDGEWAGFEGWEVMRAGGKEREGNKVC